MRAVREIESTACQTTHQAEVGPAGLAGRVSWRTAVFDRLAAFVFIDCRSFRERLQLGPSILQSVLLPVAAAGPILFYRVSAGLWTSIIFLGEGLYIQWPNR